MLPIDMPDSPKSPIGSPAPAETPTTRPPVKSTAFGLPRNFLANRFVYLVISQRAHGLSIGVDVNPGKDCNFKCVYCEVDRSVLARNQQVDLAVMESELTSLLTLVRENRVRSLAAFANLPADLIELKEVALSGDGEPTLSPQFQQIVEAVVGVRSRQILPFFKIVLITNASGLDLPSVKEALKMLSPRDEIWAKLDAGTQTYMDEINVPDIKLDEVMANILSTARTRPVVIQSLFPLFRGQEPSDAEIDVYLHRLQELKAGGAQISGVQVYSAHRPAHRSDCRHLPLAVLSRIAKRIRTETGLPAQVY